MKLPLKLPLFIAFRYLFSRKKQHIINIISAISGTGVIISTAALVIVLSIFNGFETIIFQNIKAIDPDIKILPSKGKTFLVNDTLKNILSNEPFVKNYCFVIEENALMKNNSRQRPIMLKGVTPTFLKMTNTDTLLYAGKNELWMNKQPFAIAGYSVANDLALNPFSLKPAQIFAGKKGTKQSTKLTSSLNRKSIFISGIILGGPEITENMVIVPFKFAKDLLGYKNETSAIEIKITNEEKLSRVRHKISELLGNNYVVKTRLQLNESVYKMLKTEKLSIFVILLFVLVIAAFNMLASLAMLIIDKKKDIQILKSMGADSTLIRKIFWLEGWLIVFIGSVLGIVLGLVFSFIQQEYGIIRMQGNNFISDFYPVEVQIGDIIRIFIIIQIIGFLAAVLPVRYITSKYSKSN